MTYPDMNLSETPQAPVNPMAGPHRPADSEPSLLTAGDVRLMQVGLAETTTALEQGLYKIDTMGYADEAHKAALQLNQALDVLRCALRDRERRSVKSMSKSL